MTPISPTPRPANNTRIRKCISTSKQADAAGDKKVAALFRQIAADEGDHYNAYKAALDKLKAAGN
jgi:rubrerythrin